MAPEDITPREIGTLVRGRYSILRIVGRGGLGTVYQVVDTLYGGNTVYALKELADPNPGARKQFELESHWLKELSHDSIPKVIDSFDWDGRAYLVMDFIDGENLEHYLQRTGRPAGEAQALRLMLPICDALTYLHTRTPPLLHRDVKPANIIVTPTGHPVLVDFGIAKAHMPGMGQTVTFVRKAGTEGYAPPEQYAATGMTGPWSDVYALGATLYQLLTGRVPRTAVERITETMEMPGPRSLAPFISYPTDRAVMRALELKPADRFQTVPQFAAALRDALRSLSLTRGDAQTPSPNSYSGGSLPPAFTSPVTPSAPQGKLPPLGEPLPSNLRAESEPQADARAFTAVRSPAHISAPGLASSAPALGGAISGPMGEPTPALTSASRKTSAPLQAPSGALTTPRSTGRRPPLILAAAILVLVGLAALAVYGYHVLAPVDRSSPAATVNGYFGALSQQDYAQAWQYDAQSLNNTSAQAAFTQELQADDGRYGVVRSVHIDQVTQNGSQASVTVSVTRSQVSAPMSYIVQLTEYNGSTWLIATVASQ